MNKYKIMVQEVLVKEIEIYGKTREEAITEAKRRYKNEELVLSSEDLQTVTFI